MNNRRDFLRALTAAPVAGAVAAGCTTAPRTARVRTQPTGPDVPRHIIHLVGDGMGLGILSCANHHAVHALGRPLTWFRLMDRPDLVASMMDVRSQDSLVTDSSASSSAWGSGVRIPNGRVNQLGDGTRLVTLYELLGSTGWTRALVTTTEITHATPAGFAACTKSRSEGELIATQYLERSIDLLLGGGRNHFAPGNRKDKRDLLGDFRNAGYAVLEKPADLASAPGDRPWLGVFAGGHLPYVVDQIGGLTRPDPTPSLAELTRAALGRLAGSERFVLQVEGGRVDHGCHANDAAAAIHELLSFDAAIDVCLEFQREHPDTLLVMTTDHATGGATLNGMGDGYRKSNELLHHLPEVRQSSGEILKRLVLAENDDQRRKILKEATGYTASNRRLGLLDPFLKKRGQPLFDGLNSDSAALGQLLGNHLGISFTSGNHTSDHIPLMAIGPGAERFRGFLPNTRIFDNYLDIAGIRFRNPSQPIVAASGPLPADGIEDVRSYVIA